MIANFKDTRNDITLRFAFIRKLRITPQSVHSTYHPLIVIKLSSFIPKWNFIWITSLRTVPSNVTWLTTSKTQPFTLTILSIMFSTTLGTHPDFFLLLSGQVSTLGLLTTGFLILKFGALDFRFLRWVHYLFSPLSVKPIFLFLNSCLF